MRLGSSGSLWVPTTAAQPTHNLPTPRSALSPDDYEKAKGKYIINAETMKQLRKDAIVMHPLPRVDEVRARVV